MFQHQGIWLPDGEKHFPEWMDKNGEIVDGRGTYQIKKWRACIPHIRQWRCAVDVGAHVGLWSMHLGKCFTAVRAFEPVEAFRECWIENLQDQFRGYGDPDYKCSFQLHWCALGSAPGCVSMIVPTLEGGLDTGGTHVGGYGDIEMRTLDSFYLRDVDFLKIDCEGYEHHVIEGAGETLQHCKPCVIVEQKQQKLGENFGIKGTPAVDLLLAMGAKQRAAISGDYILSWD